MLLFSVLYGILTIFSGKSLAKIAPDFIHPCNATTRECLIKATQDAIPEFVEGMPALTVEALDPFLLQDFTIPLSGLKFTLKNGKANGFRHCIIDNVISLLEKRYFEMEFHTNLTIKGQYAAIGKFLLFPIDGSGDAKIKITNLKMKLSINTKYTKDNDGQNHFAIKNYNYTFSYGDNMSFDLQNLFKGNKEFSATILKFMNENWKTVAEEIGKPVVDYAVQLVVDRIKKFFEVVPYEELIYVPIPK